MREPLLADKSIHATASPSFMKKQPRIGLFGGSFDPIHLGHLVMMQDALEQADLDHIRVIPAAQSPFKQTACIADKEKRLAMIRAALAGRPQLLLETCEIDAGGTSYSYRTAQKMAKRFPGSELFWIIGADHLGSLTQWRCAEELAATVTFLCIGRPGYDFDASALPSWIKWHIVNGHTMDIASTDIRNRIGQGKAVDLFVPTAVHTIIKEQHLYS